MEFYNQVDETGRFTGLKVYNRGIDLQDYSPVISYFCARKQYEKQRRIMGFDKLPYFLDGIVNEFEYKRIQELRQNLSHVRS